MGELPNHLHHRPAHGPERTFFSGFRLLGLSLSTVRRSGPYCRFDGKRAEICGCLRLKTGRTSREPPSLRSTLQDSSSFSEPRARVQASPQTEANRFVSALAKAVRASSAQGELRWVDNAKIDRKNYKPRRPNRRPLTTINLPRHSEISSHGFSPRLRSFLRLIVVKLRFRLRCPRNLMGHRRKSASESQTRKRRGHSDHRHRFHRARDLRLQVEEWRLESGTVRRI
jgi:hypothetical protein